MFNNTHGLISFAISFFVYSSIEKNGKERKKSGRFLEKSHDHVQSFSHTSRENGKEKKWIGNKERRENEDYY